MIADAGTITKKVAGLGQVTQLGFVPRDFEAALKFWTEVMGVGPFFDLAHLPLVDVQYRGQAIDLDVSAAIGYWGDLQIELIRQHNDGPSLFSDWINSGKEGLNHVRIDVDGPDEAREIILPLGGTPLLEAQCPGMGGFIYFDMGGPGPYVEASYLDPSLYRLFDYFKEAAVHWDGSEPFRPIPDVAEWS